MNARAKLTEDEFQAWRGHPVTETVHRYLRDLAGTIRAEWSEGESWTDEARIRVQCFEDLSAVALDDLTTFYQEKEERESDEHESSA